MSEEDSSRRGTDTGQRAVNDWNATDYDEIHGFVHEYGAGLLELLDPRPGERVLDLGCGTGHLTADAAEAVRSDGTVLGIDRSVEMVGLDSYDEHYASDQPALVATDCRHCSFFNNVPVESVLLDHPGVIGRLYERGLDVRERYLWELPFVVDPECVQVAGEDPGRVTVTAGTGLSGPALHVTVDASGSITGVTER